MIAVKIVGHAYYEIPLMAQHQLFFNLLRKCS